MLDGQKNDSQSQAQLMLNERIEQLQFLKNTRALLGEILSNRDKTDPQIIEKLTKLDKTISECEKLNDEFQQIINGNDIRNFEN